MDLRGRIHGIYWYWDSEILIGRDSVYLSKTRAGGSKRPRDVFLANEIAICKGTNLVVSIRWILPYSKFSTFLDSELQIQSLKLLIATYLKQIDQLDKQHSEMKEKVEALKKQNEENENEEDIEIKEEYEDLSDEERQRLIPIIVRQVKKR